MKLESNNSEIQINHENSIHNIIDTVEIDI